MGKVYRQNKDIVFRPEEDEAIMFNPDNSDIIVINSTGCFIWQMFNGKNTKEDIVANMTKEFDVGKEKASEDLEDFVSKLEKKDFIEKIK